MAQPRVFLTAEWRNLIGVTFACPRERLEPHVPPGVEIDELEGSPRISLVAFEFFHTCVLGLPIPGHVRFPEINLRFYVRHRGERAVVFLRELVPRRAVATVARLRYNEPYTRVPMRAQTTTHGDALTVTHRFAAASSVSVTATTQTHEPGPADRWLTDHALGVGRLRNGTVVLYDVAHPTWPLHTVTDTRLDVDFEAVYGPEWAWLRDATPSHVSLATGSAVTVSRPVPAARR